MRRLRPTGRLRTPAAALALIALTAGCSSSASPSTHHRPHTGGDGSRSRAVGRIVRRVAVGRYPDGVVAGFGSLWTADLNSNTVTRVDPADGRVVTRIPAGPGPISLLIAAGRVWAADYNGSTVVRIDPLTDRVAQTIHVGLHPVSLVQVGSTVWALNQAAKTASLIDAASGVVTATVPVHAQSGFAALAAGRLWVPDFQGGSGPGPGDRSGDTSRRAARPRRQHAAPGWVRPGQRMGRQRARRHGHALRPGNGSRAGDHPPQL